VSSHPVTEERIKYIQEIKPETQNIKGKTIRLSGFFKIKRNLFFSQKARPQ
jgi:predicted Zn-dependent protease